MVYRHVVAQLVRVTAFGLGVTYGGYRLASLKQRKQLEDEEKHKREIQDAVSKALATREQQAELALSMFYYIWVNIIFW